MNTLNNIFEFLRGKKTYAIGILMVILGILQGNNQLILEGLGFIFVRAGISKI